MARWSTMILTAGLTGTVAVGWHVSVNPVPWSTPAPPAVTSTAVEATPPVDRRDHASTGRPVPAPLLLTMTDPDAALVGGPAHANTPPTPAAKSDPRPRRVGKAKPGKRPGRRANTPSVRPGTASRANGPPSDPAAHAPNKKPDRAPDRAVEASPAPYGVFAGDAASAGGPAPSGANTGSTPAGRPMTGGPGHPQFPASSDHANRTTPVIGSLRLGGRAGHVPRRGSEATGQARHGRLDLEIGTGAPPPQDVPAPRTDETPAPEPDPTPEPGPEPGPGPGDDPAPGDGIGGCCLPALPAMCVEMPASACAGVGGVYLGDDSSCDQLMRRIARVGADFTMETTTTATCRLSPRGFDEGIDGPVKVDAWVTLGGDRAACATILRLGCPIPADFFRPTSGAIQPELCLEGAPIGPTFVPGFGQPLDFGLADTLVMRLADPFARCDAPTDDGVTVPIAIERLRLVSREPIEVPLVGGIFTEAWDVRVDVDTSLGQPLGSITARKTHGAGGTYDSVMRVCPTITFISTENGDERVLDYCATCDPGGLEMITLDVPWVSDAGDTLEVHNPVRSAFRPGVEAEHPLPTADCNGNGVADDCDIAFGQSRDDNGDGVPDDCVCPLDLDGDGDVDLDDLFAVLADGDVVDLSAMLEIISSWGACGGL